MCRHSRSARPRSNTSKPTTRNAIAQAVGIALLVRAPLLLRCVASSILTYGEAMMVAHTKATHYYDHSKPYNLADEQLERLASRLR
jgi:hypothetical protein